MSREHLGMSLNIYGAKKLSLFLNYIVLSFQEESKKGERHGTI